MSNYIIIDIKQKSNLNELYFQLSEYNKNPENIFITLTPYSTYICDVLNINYQHFHTFITTKKFRDNVLDKTKYLEEKITLDFDIIMGKLIPLISLMEYRNILEVICQNKEITLVTNDEDKEILELTYHKKIVVKKIVVKKYFYFIKKILICRNIFTCVIKKIFALNLRYDWAYYVFDILHFFRIYKTKQCPIKIKNLYNNVSFFLSTYIKNEYISCIILSYCKQLDCNYKKRKVMFFNSSTSIKELLIRSENFSISYQHGNDLYNNILIKYDKIKFTDINFVFNDYTKKLFENLGAKKVYSVGSILFNQNIKEKKKKYDFLYITQGHDYMGTLQYVDFQNSLHSFDGYELYQRHKSIIELFGTRLKEKKILIRVHPCVLTIGVYVPFWELSEPYPNITIDVSIPISTLIGQSKYIISDYFTTEFINRELHYKRDIILFQGAPTPLPKETVEDMQKMFILVDTIDDLENKIKNIEYIKTNRKRYDDIIEYYSSKKCNTKKVVTQILKQELNGR